MSAAASFRSDSLAHVLTPFHLKCARKGSFDLGDTSYIAHSCITSWLDRRRRHFRSGRVDANSSELSRA